MLGYLSADIICSEEANSFPRAKLKENCELRGTDNVRGQISEHIFAPNGGYCLYYPSNLFRNARNFQNWGIYNNYSISPSWIWSDKITDERVARVGYKHFISNKGEWNNCFSKFSNRVLPPFLISKILQSVRKENLAHYFPYDVKLRLLAHSRSFLANQKARNAIVGAENLLNSDIPQF